MKYRRSFRFLATLLCLMTLIASTASSEEGILEQELLQETCDIQPDEFESQSSGIVPMSASPDALPMEAGIVTELVLTSNGATSLNVGDQLQIRLDGVEAVSWKSSKAKVAAVSETGLVTAQSKGKAKITVATAAKKKYTLTLTVVDPYEPASIGIAQGGQITMNVGDALVLTPVLAPETARTTFTWKSSKGKVASVGADGAVSALAEGKTKITVTTANKKKVTTVVNVVDPYKPSEVGIAQGGQITMNVGDVLVLTPVLAPETARTTFTWKSSKGKVASVGADGAVSALAEGKTKITVTTANKKKVTTVVNVVDPYKPSEVGIAQGGEITLTVGQSLQLTPTLAPDTARTTFTWKSSKKKVASVSADGVVTATAAGTTKITVTTANKKKVTTLVHVVAATSSGNTSIPAVQYTSVNYNDILQNPNGYNNAVYQFTGKVFQVCEEKSKKGGTALIELIVSTGSGGSGNAIYLTYTRQKNDHCFVKGEFANITAVCKGLYSYSTTSDSIATVPLFEGYSVALASSPTSSGTDQQLIGEISSILGQNFSRVNELIPDKFRYYKSNAYTNDYILVENNTAGKIISVALLTDASSGIGKYTIFGIYPGISRSKAVGILANFGWLPLNNSATTNYYYNSSKPYQVVYLTYLNGKIDLVLYEQL